MSKKKTLTTAAGIPVPDNQTSLTAGERGPTLMQDHYLLEKLAHFNRERIPERVVHAKAAGAHGTLTVTHDITQYTKAKLFSEVGKQTEMFGRFSTVALSFLLLGAARALSSGSVEAWFVDEFRKLDRIIATRTLRCRLFQLPVRSVALDRLVVEI